MVSEIGERDTPKLAHNSLLRINSPGLNCRFMISSSSLEWVRCVKEPGDGSMVLTFSSLTLPIQKPALTM